MGGTNLPRQTGVYRYLSMMKQFLNNAKNHPSSHERNDTSRDPTLGANVLSFWRDYAACEYPVSSGSEPDVRTWLRSHQESAYHDIPEESENNQVEEISSH